MKMLKNLLFVSCLIFTISASFSWAGEDIDISNYREPMEGISTGGQPSEDDLEALAEQGVTMIVNFRAPGEFDDFDEKAAVENLGMTYLNIPIPKMKNDLTPENAKLLHEALEGANGPVFLHCTIGMRAGAMLALDQYYFHGASEDEAIEVGVAAHMDHLVKYIEDTIEKHPKD